MSDDLEAQEPFSDLDLAGALQAAFTRPGPADLEHPPRKNAARAHASDRAGYELHGELARGGMGVIVKAYDRGLGRAVALKVLREELAHEPKLVRRFLEEARVTARLDHPGIVPVHEVGFNAQGRAFFAMRLVRGRDLRRIIELAQAEQEGWNITRALSAMLKVCEAMAYAHERGVIHRDLKPSNIMVGEFGEVYVMDWGLARVIGRADARDLRLRTKPERSSAQRDPHPPTRPHADDGARRTDNAHEQFDSPTVTTGEMDSPIVTPVEFDSPIVTMDGEVLGTPCYMAPEQAQGRIHELGPCSDVYSTGALLYHLLAGELPYVPAGTSSGSRAVLLRLVEGPPRPLHELRPELAPELVAICEKAMARAPAQRYPDMLAMAHDLRAFLERRVVSAYETGAWAQARKWIARNKPLAGALAGVVMALVVGLLVSLALEAESDANYVRAERGAQVATEERDKALKIASFLEDTLHGVGPSVARGRDTHMLREMMDAARARIEHGELSAAPEAELRLMLVISEAYHDSAQYERAEPLLERSVERATALFRGDHALLARSLCELGAVKRERGNLAAAEPLLRRGLQMRERLFPGDHVDVAEALGKLAMALQDKSELVEAEALLRRALAMRERIFAGDHESTALAASNLAVLLIARGDLSGAEQFLRPALAMQERLFRGDHPELASSIDSLATVAGARADNDAAVALHRRALEMRRRLYAGDHPNVALSLNNLAVALYEQNDPAGAEPLMREALEMRRRLFADDQVCIAQNLGNLAGLLHARGDLDGAEPLYREALAMLRRLFPDDNPVLADHLGNLAVLLKQRRDFDGAEALYREALAMLRRLFAGDHPTLALCIYNLARLQEARDDLAGAESSYREALAMRGRLFQGDHPAVLLTSTSLASVLSRERRFAEADELLLAAANALEHERGARRSEYQQCVRRAIENCTRWEAADTDLSIAAKTLEWQSKLSESEHE